MTVDFTGYLPALPIIGIGEEGVAFLTGSRCGHCGEIYPGERMACASCFAREGIEPIRLGSRGKLYNYTIIHRSYPGVPVPFVGAIVDLAGGGTLRGTLLDVDPDPAKLPYDLPVDIVFRDTGQKGPGGKPFVSYYFVPSEGQA